MSIPAPAVRTASRPRARLRRWQSAPWSFRFSASPLRESFREDGRVRQRTLTNLSAWSTGLIEGFGTPPKGGVAVVADGIRVRRALPDGHAAALLGTIRAISLDRLLGKPADK